MIRKILIIELAGIGDLIMAFPAIKALRRRYPDAYIAALTLARSEGLLSSCPYIDESFVFYENLFSPRSIWRNLRAAVCMRRKDFDIAINLYYLYSIKGALKMMFLLRLIKAKKTLGRNTNGKGLFYDIKVEDSMPLRKHKVESIMDVAKALDCKESNYMQEVWISEEDEKYIQEFLNQSAISKEQFIIGINPGGNRPSRRWPIENFAQVADALAEKYNAKIVVTGNLGEMKLAARLSNMMKIKPVITTGKLSLIQLSAFIKRCNLYITNDSGPMHIANALEKPLIAIMGPGVLESGPYNRKNCIVVKKEVECSPCYKFYCKSLVCLKGIMPSEVVDAANKLLSRQQPTSSHEIDRGDTSFTTKEGG